MTLLDVRETAPVTETPWERLRRLIDLRRTRLDLTLAGIDAVGGPSPKWVHRLTTYEGEPSIRMRASLQDLDRALQWPDGTSWGLLTDDRTGWSDELLQDEEKTLIEIHDEVDNFAWLVAARLRALPESERYRVMSQFLSLLEIDRNR